MREYRFRGKHEGKYNTYWVEGFGIHIRPDGLVFIINQEDGMWYEVNPDTVGQYTRTKR